VSGLPIGVSPRNVIERSQNDSSGESAIWFPLDSLVWHQGFS